MRGWQEPPPRIAGARAVPWRHRTPRSPTLSSQQNLPMIIIPTHSSLALAVARLLGAALLVAGDARGTGPASQSMTVSQVTVTYPTGARLFADVADPPAKRASGRRFGDRLPPEGGR